MLKHPLSSAAACAAAALLASPALAQSADLERVENLELTGDEILDLSGVTVTGLDVGGNAQFSLTDGFASSTVRFDDNSQTNSSTVIRDNGTATLDNVGILGVQPQSINLTVVDSGTAVLRGGTSIEDFRPVDVRDNGQLIIEDASIQKIVESSTFFGVLLFQDDASGIVSGGSFTLIEDQPSNTGVVLLRGRSQLEVSGGIFVNDGNPSLAGLQGEVDIGNDPVDVINGTFNLFDESSLTIIGNAGTFALNGINLGLEDGQESTITDSFGILTGTLANGDPLDGVFLRSPTSQLVIRSAADAPGPTSPTTPNVVPTPSALAGGLLLGLGLLRRRR